MSDFMQFAHSHGLIINSLRQGQIVRCPTQEHRAKRNGAYFFDGLFGWIQNWATHERPVIWKSDAIQDTPVFRQKIKDSQKKYQQEKARAGAQAAQKSHWILSQCELDLSSYLARKGFPDTCGNMWKKDGEYLVLVVPMHKDNKLVGCQLIDHEGNKKFLKGQETNDACFTIGNGKQVFFVEGYASGLSLQSILSSLKISYRIIVTFSAGNLSRFAKRMEGIVIADNDASGTGQRVAAESGRRWWMPPVTGHDINDYHRLEGAFKASQEIKKLLYTR